MVTYEQICDKLGFDVLTYEELKDYYDIPSIKIYIQDSKKGRDISLIGLDENEILYERNSIFKVINVLSKNGVWYILLEEV